jgi:23S rRNA (adenine2503-C2)-methyltransferase
MRPLAEYDVGALEAELLAWGERPSHARRLLRAFYDGAGALDLDSLSMRGSLRERLRRDWPARLSQEHTRHESADGTTKLLLRLPDGAAVETVLMPSYRPGLAAGCVSSQVGCAVGCDFCASTRRGLVRNLAPAEIVEQFLALSAEARSVGRRLKTLVFMGMGEPLLNLDAVLVALRAIAHPDHGALGWKNVTVSTVGIVPGIEKLAEADLGVSLALSLHAPDDETRARLVPVNRRYPVAEILDAAKRYAARTKTIPTIEYCLLGGVNDSDEQADLLAERLAGWRVHVNLIPYNQTGAGRSGVL